MARPRLHCKGASASLPHFMQLPFLLAFISLLSLAQPHLLSTATEEFSIGHKPFVYETVAASFLASHSQGGSSLHTNVPKEESDILVDDGLELKKVPTIAKPFIYESVAASLHSGANTQGSHVRNNVPSFIYESVAASHHSTVRGGSAVRDNIWQEENVSLLDEGDKPRRDPIIRKEEPIIANPAFIYESVLDSMHLEAHEGSYLRDNAPQAEISFHLKDGGKHVQSGANREEPIVPKPSFIYESVGASVRSGTRRGGFLRDNMENTFLLDNGGKQVGKSPSKVASSTQRGGDLLRDSVPQEKYEFLRDDGHMRPVSGAQRPDHDSEEETFLHDEVPEGEYSLLLAGDGGRKELHIKELPAFKDEKRKNYMKLPIYNKQRPGRGNLRTVVDDSVEAHDRMPEAKAGTPNEENLRMVVGDSSNNMVQKGYWTSRGRSRSCTSNSNVCRRLAHEEYMNHIVLYGRPSRMRSREQPACCGGTCVDLSYNSLNCGICNRQCRLLETCCSGECVNLDINDSNCGECGNACSSSTSCKMGMCGY